MLFLLVLLCSAGSGLAKPGSVDCGGAAHGPLVNEEGGDATAPPLTEEEMDASHGLSEEELTNCFGVTPSGLDDKDKLEGDIATPDGSNLDGVQLSGLSSASRLWPGGRIPYTLSVAYSPVARAAIAAAFRQLQEATCLTLVPKTDEDRDYIRIFPDGGCYSYVGRLGGEQPVSLAAGCLVNGIIIHEVFHAAGFIHEHSRPDRDQYIRIISENIRPGLEGQFSKYPQPRVAELGVGYDFSSLMHYRPTAFTANGQPTIVRIAEGEGTMGQRNGMSPKDIQKVRKLYQCPEEEREDDFGVCPEGTPARETMDTLTPLHVWGREGKDRGECNMVRPIWRANMLGLSSGPRYVATPGEELANCYGKVVCDESEEGVKISGRYQVCIDSEGNKITPGTGDSAPYFTAYDGVCYRCVEDSQASQVVFFESPALGGAGVYKTGLFARLRK